MAPSDITNRCAYCSTLTAVPEQEHVFPESWYPDGTPPSTMLTVPSCAACNDKYDPIEERMRILALTVDREHPAARGVAARVERSFREAAGKNPRDRERREKKRQSLERRLRVTPVDERHRALPNLAQFTPSLIRTPAGIWAYGLPSIRFDPADLAAITEKFTRGVYWLDRRMPLVPSVPVATPVMTKDPFGAAEAIIRKYGFRPRGVPPAFVYWGIAGIEDPSTSFWIFLVWGHFVWTGLTGKLVENERGWPNLTGPAVTGR